MSSRATNAALNDVHDEGAILLNFWGNPLMNGAGQSPHTPNQLERWREMTAWVDQMGGAVIINEVATQIRQDSNLCLHETLAEIMQLASLEENWNDEGAPAVDRDCIHRARDFVQRLACQVDQRLLMEDDFAPAVFPDIDGGVNLYWKAHGRQTALAFRPGQRLIDVMEKSQGMASSYRAVSEDEVGAIALRAMRIRA